MAKILLVEDDNNLREIYEARLMAEGYEIVSARDGEEALTVAMKEKPDLVISDVMMPKISGFDMLDILRTTEETKNVKVIMMTALSQAEDKARAEKLGADRYLVKSQVTLEDVAKVAKEVLEGTPANSPAPASTESTTPAPTPDPTPAPVAPAPTEPATPVSTDDKIESEEKAIAQQIEGMIAKEGGETASTGTPTPDPTPTPTPVAATTPTPPAEPATSAPAPDPAPAPADEPAAAPVAPDPTPATTTSTGPATDSKPAKKVIEPINDLSVDMKPKLDELLAKEQEREENSPVANNTTQQVGSATPPAPSTEVSGPETPIKPPEPNTKIDPNSIAL